MTEQRRGQEAKGAAANGAPDDDDRPPKFEPKELENVAAKLCTLREAADYFGVPLRTLRAKLKQEPWLQAWRRGQSRGRLALRSAQLELADKNATVAIHLGKEVLGQHGPQAQAKADEDGDKTRARAGDRPARDEIARRIAGVAARGRAPGDPGGAERKGRG